MFRLPPKAISLLVIISFIFLPIKGYSLPEGESIPDGGGAATFSSTPDTFTVSQLSDKLIVNYQGFSIAAPETVRFIQPNTSSIALNRVFGIDPSSILGTLSANGRIFLINPNGILFGQGCNVDTAGMLASSLNIADNDFLAGRYTFFGQGGAVVNQGYIFSPGGFVSLLGSNVENTGVIEANLGSVALASGNAMTLNLDPKGLISVVVDEATIANPENKDSAVKNSGTIKADGGKVLLTAKTLEGVFNKAVNNEGIIEAGSLVDNKGEVALLATGTNNLAANIGSIDVSAKEVGAAGGNVEISGDRVIVDGKINTAGNQASDGAVLIDPFDIYVLSYPQTLPDGTDSYILESFLEGYDTGSWYINSSHDVIFDLTDNHLNLQHFIGADFSTAPYTAGRNFSVNAGRHIDAGDTMIETQGGSVYFSADNAHTATGNIWFNSGSGIITHGGNIELHAANIYLHGARLEAIGNPSELGYEQQINLRMFAQPQVAGEVYVPGPGEIHIEDSFLTVETGPCNSNVDPTGRSFAQMDLRANTEIEIEDSELTSKKTTGNGDATIRMDAWQYNPSYTDSLGTSNIYIDGSFNPELGRIPSKISAIVNGDGNAEIRMQVDQGIYIGDYDDFLDNVRTGFGDSVYILSDVNGQGKSSIEMYNINYAERSHILVHQSSIRAEAERADNNLSQQYAEVYLGVPTGIGVQDSLIEAMIKDWGNANVNLSVTGAPYPIGTWIEDHLITEAYPSILIDGSTLQAEITNNGRAEVNIWSHPSAPGVSDGGIAITGLVDEGTGNLVRKSQINAFVGGGGEANVNIGSLYSDVNIAYADLLASIFTGMTSSRVAVDARHGDLNLAATTIEAYVETDGNSSVSLNADKDSLGGKGNIRITDESTVSSRTEGNGAVSVDIQSEADTLINDSLIKSLVAGYTIGDAIGIDADGTLTATGLTAINTLGIGDGDHGHIPWLNLSGAQGVTLNNCNLTSRVLSINPAVNPLPDNDDYGKSAVQVQSDQGDVNITGGNFLSEILGRGYAFIGISAAQPGNTHLNTVNIDGLTATAHSLAGTPFGGGRDYSTGIGVTGYDVNVANSIFRALVDNDGDTQINFWNRKSPSLSDVGSGEIHLDSVLAESIVSGNGQALVHLYTDEPGVSIGFSGLFHVAGASTLRSQVGSGYAQTAVDGFSTKIDDSFIEALVNNKGKAEIDVRSWREGTGVEISRSHIKGEIKEGQGDPYNNDVAIMIQANTHYVSPTVGSSVVVKDSDIRGRAIDSGVVNIYLISDLSNSVTATVGDVSVLGSLIEGFANAGLVNGVDVYLGTRLGGDVGSPTAGGNIYVTDTDISSTVNGGARSRIELNTNQYKTTANGGNIAVTAGSNLFASSGYNGPDSGQETSVNLIGNNILIENSHLKTSVASEIAASYISSGSYRNTDILGSTLETIANGWARISGIWLGAGEGPTGNLNIADKTGTRSKLSVEANGSATNNRIDIEVKDDVTITNSDLSVSVTSAEANLGDSILQIYGRIGDPLDNIDVTGSTISSIVNGNANYYSYLRMDADNTVDISDSDLQAIVNGNGKTFLWLWGNNGINVLGNSSLVTDVTGSMNTGELNIYLYSYEGPINVLGGSGLLERGLIQSKVGYGTSFIRLESEGTQGINISNFAVISQSGYGTALIDLFASGPISVSGTGTDPQDQATRGLYAHTEAGVSSARIRLISYNGDINLGNTLIEAVDDMDGPSSIEVRADDGGINSDNSELYTHAGLGDSTIQLYSSGGDISLVDTLLESVVESEGYSSNGLFADGGSILGNSGSLIDASYVWLFAQYSIGASGSPINIDADSLGAYSWGVGDIFVNEANSVELGIISPVGDGEGGGVSVSANDGIVNIVSDDDMIVNSIISPRGGVFLESTNGSIYAGRGWLPYAEQGFPYFIKWEFNDYIRSVPLMSISETPWADEEGDIFSPFVSYIGDGGPNVIAGGYSYFSTPKGTIGVGWPGEKDPIMSGGIYGTVQPGTTAITSVFPSPGFDFTPSGYVLYHDRDLSEGPQQIWPLALGVDLTFENPLGVWIELVNAEQSAVRPGFVPAAALTLNYGNPIVSPAALNVTSQLANPLIRTFRAYYEILDPHRFVSVEPATPTTFFAYHPLTLMDSSAFDAITLDISAYDFIEGNINLKKALAPYLGVVK